MFNNYKSFFYTFDLIGEIPQLLIFNNRRYKTLFSSIFSIIIIFFSIIFIILSLIQYLKYENPIVVYSKNNDIKTKRTIFINDTLLMLQIVDISNLKAINNSIAYYNADYSAIYDNGSYENTFLEIEKCELGKNINLKYKDIINEKYKFGRNLDDFYCISFKNNKSLFYHPQIGYSFINLRIIMKNSSIYSPGQLQSLIVTENDLIDHSNKEHPINDNFIYYFSSSYSPYEYSKINYRFQYIHYESDDGFFFKNSKIFNGVTFSDKDFFRNIQNNYDFNKNLQENNINEIGVITFEINQSYFDSYKRSYPRLQSLLAEIMSVISLVFEIGRQISFILCDKKMSRDIIRNLLSNKENNLLTQENINKINKKLTKKEIFSENIKIKNEITEKTNISYSLDKEEFENKSNISKYGSEKSKILKQLNYYYIIKSFFCPKDKKTKLINLCHNIITEDISVERILKRFYEFEGIYNFLLSDEEGNFNHFKDTRLNEINKCIDEINNDIKTIRENKFRKLSKI